MPRPFNAPMPIYNDFRRVRDIDDAAVRKFLAWVSPEVERLLLEDPLPDKRVIHWARTQLAALFLVPCLIHVRDFAYRAVQTSNDSLVVDDFFLTLINPDLQQDMESLFWRRELAQDFGETHGQRLVAAVEGWVKGRGRKSYPGLRVSSIGPTVASPRGNPPCWHSQAHNRLRRRGPRFRPERRAATWATYVVSWLVGSETGAVRLWNKFLLPSGYHWGNGSAPLAHALSKYADAKARLIRDLRCVGGQYLVPERPILRPLPALDTKTAVVLEGEIERWTRLEVPWALAGAAA